MQRTIKQTAHKMTKFVFFAQSTRTADAAIPIHSLAEYNLFYIYSVNYYYNTLGTYILYGKYFFFFIIYNYLYMTWTSYIYFISKGVVYMVWSFARFVCVQLCIVYVLHCVCECNVMCMCNCVAPHNARYMSHNAYNPHAPNRESSNQK